ENRLVLHAQLEIRLRHRQLVQVGEQCLANGLHRISSPARNRRLSTEYRTDQPRLALSEVTRRVRNSRRARAPPGGRELFLAVIGRSECGCALATNSYSIRWSNQGATPW